MLSLSICGMTRVLQRNGSAGNGNKMVGMVFDHGDIIDLPNGGTYEGYVLIPGVYECLEGRRMMERTLENGKVDRQKEVVLTMLPQRSRDRAIYVFKRLSVVVLHRMCDKPTPVQKATNQLIDCIMGTGPMDWAINDVIRVSKRMGEW